MGQACNSVLLLGILLLISIKSIFSVVHEWGYHYGVLPDKWGTLFPTCDGQKQSPIDIKTNEVMCDRSLDTFDLTSLHETYRVNMILENVGYGVQVDLSGKKLIVRNGRLPGPYIIEQFHFHWGSTDMRGSEHEINGKHFSMEMHIVMYSSKFNSVRDAMNSTNGLAVLGCLVDVGDHNEKFDEIINHLRDIKHKDDKVRLRSFSILGLLPKSTENYYRYYGSLTTPACYESVIWSILTEHTYISEEQLNTFRALGLTHFTGSENLINNYRNPQPLNGRVVRTNDKKFCKGHHWNYENNGNHGVSHWNYGNNGHHGVSHWNHGNNGHHGISHGNYENNGHDGVSHGTFENNGNHGVSYGNNGYNSHYGVSRSGRSYSHAERQRKFPL